MTARSLASARVRTMLFGALLLPALLSTARARAFADPERFAEPSTSAGGAGRFFTGTPADGYTCKVCHEGGEPVPLQVLGFPGQGYVPGLAYEISVIWPITTDKIALAVELTDATGRGAGSVRLPLGDEAMPGDFCEPIDARVEAAIAISAPNDRVILNVPDCGARQLRFLWTAPAIAPGDIWLAGSAVHSDGMGDLPGDGVTDFARVVAPARSEDALPAEIQTGCHALADRGAPGTPDWLLGISLFLLVLLRTRRRRLRRATASVLVLLAILTGPSSSHAQDEAAAAVYVRADNDQTTVVSPHVRAAKRLGEATTVDLGYAADIWSSASIDIRASASVMRVTEQRDEVDVALTHAPADLTLSLAYRFSTEHDYTSHGGTLGAAYAFADNAATLSTSLRVFGDVVGHAGDESFARDLLTLDGVLSFTQVIDPKMFIQATYELAHSSGYLASPYRYVGIGGSGFGCVGAILCLPEDVPDARTRHALALLVRRALSDAVSVGAAYRYYFDDWGLGSHTAALDLGWAIDRVLLGIRYRYYVQNAVEFYRIRYLTLVAGEKRTRDRELSELTYHRIGADLEYELGLRDDDVKLSTALSLAGNFYGYSDFVGLDEVAALEVSLALIFKL